MAIGLAIPLRAVLGRAPTASGDTQMKKVIALALGDGESTNPFNGEDVGTKPSIWRMNNAATRALVERSIKRHFTHFEADGRARLLSVAFEKGGEGELKVLVRYLDLETDESRIIEHVGPRG